MKKMLPLLACVLMIDICREAKSSEEPEFATVVNASYGRELPASPIVIGSAPKGDTAVAKSKVAARNNKRPMNVLFLAIDDLRPQLGCYCHQQMITPNIDALAEHGITFNSAYCQSAICGLSRASLLSGLHR